VRGVPHQLTFGTLNEIPVSVSATGTAALHVGTSFTDLYLIPLSPATGQPTSVARRLTQDRRDKDFMWSLGGNPGSAYFRVSAGTAESVYAVDLDTGKQTLVTAGSRPMAISPDGRQVVYTVPEGDSYSIRVGDAGNGPAEARILCKACGFVIGFSPDGRFLFYDPEFKIKDYPEQRWTVRLLEVASGKDRPWLEHATDSVFVGNTLGQDSGWLTLVASPPGSPWSRRRYLVRWREDPVPQSEWIKIPLADGTGDRPPWRVSPTGNFFYLFEESKLMFVRFNPKTASFGEPHDVKYMPGSAVTLKPDDVWTVRGPRLVFSRQETGSWSVWLMKLPR